jgi:hypothetical protein
MAMRSTLRSARLLAALSISALALAACANSKPNPTPIDFQGLGSGSAGDAASFGRVGGEDSGVILGNTKAGAKSAAGGGGGGGIGVNAYLWRGALDTLGFMPLNAIDPFGGVIITDWYTPPESSGERFKATAYVLTKDLRSDGVRVTFFRQVLQGGHWVDTPMAESTASQIEDKVLAKARKLREQSVGSNG